MSTDPIGTPRDHYAVIPNISAPEPSGEPISATDVPPFDLSEYAYVSFLRSPSSPAAHAFVAAVAELIRPHLGPRAQAAGSKGKARLLSETGFVLAGLLSSHHRSKVTAAPRDMKAKLWTSSPLGFRAFWTKVDAMIAAGLVGTRLGIGFKNVWGAQDGAVTRLWPLQRLLDLAAQHGSTSATLRQDWPVTRTGERRELARADLVTFAPMRKGSGGHGITIDAPSSASGLADQVERLNTMAAAVTITGCCPPVLQRKFFGSPSFGGRFYAKGADSYQGIKREERASIRIDGEPLVEVDLSASYLSIFLAMMDAPAPAGDAYALGLRNVPRAAIKQWFMQTMQTGELCARWGRDAPLEARRVAPIRMARAALETYPALAQLGSWLPQQLRRGVHPAELGWAGAMRLQAIESDTIADTLTALMDAGCLALPLHDAVLVPASQADLAAEALQRSFTARLGRPGVVKVKAASDRSR